MSFWKGFLCFWYSNCVSQGLVVTCSKTLYLCQSYTSFFVATDCDFKIDTGVEDKTSISYKKGEHTIYARSANPYSSFQPINNKGHLQSFNLPACLHLSHKNSESFVESDSRANMDERYPVFLLFLIDTYCFSSRTVICANFMNTSLFCLASSEVVYYLFSKTRTIESFRPQSHQELF